MSHSQVLLQTAFILQHRKYRESSLILDVLTRDYGIISILARGVRKSKSKTAGVLLAFTGLKISYIDKHELKILTHVELAETSIKLEKISLYCGFYVNELLTHFLHKNDPHPEVYQAYKQCLVSLSQTQNTEQILRFFELDLIEYIGYGFDLSINTKNEEPVVASQKYYYDPEVGLVDSETGYISGTTLRSLALRENLNTQGL